MFLAASGNVGLGNRVPPTRTSTSKTVPPALRLTGTSSSEQWEMRMNGSGHLNFQRQSDGVNLLSLRQFGNVIQLTPQTSAPATCAIGEMYVDDSGALCFCSATNTWSAAAGGGTCA